MKWAYAVRASSRSALTWLEEAVTRLFSAATADPIKPVVLVLSLFFLLSLPWILLRWTRSRIRSKERRSRVRRAARAYRGEKEAAAFLRNQGYHIIDQQVEKDIEVIVDAIPRGARVRADYLAQRGGRLYLVEVKTGRQAPDPLFPATRRQLFEYAHVFDVDGILLLDMESRVLREVVFGGEGGRGRARSGRWASVIVLWIALAFGAGLAIGLGVGGGDAADSGAARD